MTNWCKVKLAGAGRSHSAILALAGRGGARRICDAFGHDRYTSPVSKLVSTRSDWTKRGPAPIERIYHGPIEEYSRRVRMLIDPLQLRLSPPSTPLFASVNPGTLSSRKLNFHSRLHTLFFLSFFLSSFFIGDFRVKFRPIYVCKYTRACERDLTPWLSGTQCTKLILDYSHEQYFLGDSFFYWKLHVERLKSQATYSFYKLKFSYIIISL